MQMSQNQRILVGAVVLVVIIGAWLIYSGRHKQPAKEIEANQQQVPPSEKSTSSTKPTALDQANVLEGTLRNSDNTKKGNLMLVMENRTLYISTSRDFSALIGKKVKVTYEGTPEDFHLGDIVEAIEQ